LGGNAVDLSPLLVGEGWVRRIKSCLYNSPHPNLLPLEKELILKSTALGLGGENKIKLLPLNTDIKTLNL